MSGLALTLLLRFPGNFLVWPPYLMDLDVYRAVADRLLHGDALRLYDPTTSELMPFKYAPCWALLWMPLAWLSSHATAVVWATLTVLWLILACWGSLRLCQRAGLGTPPWVSAAVVSVLVRSITAEFLNGQVDLLWALLVIGFFVWHHSATRPWLAAGSLAFAIALKLPALIVLAYLVVRRHWHTVARVLALLLATNLGTSFLLAPAHPFVLFARWLHVLQSSGVSRAFEIGNQTLFSLIARFFSADAYRLNLLDLSTPAVFLIGFLVFTLLFWLIVRSPRPQPHRCAQWLWDGALLTTLMVLCSPTAWVATYSALLLPVVVAIAAIATYPRLVWRDVPSRILMALAVMLSVMTHSSFWKALGIRYLRGESYVFLVLMILPFFALMLFSLLLRQRALLAREVWSSARTPSA